MFIARCMTKSVFSMLTKNDLKEWKVVWRWIWSYIFIKIKREFEARFILYCGNLKNRSKIAFDPRFILSYRNPEKWSQTADLLYKIIQTHWQSWRCGWLVIDVNFLQSIAKIFWQSYWFTPSCRWKMGKAHESYLHSVTDLSFSASVPAVPNNNSSHICKSDRLTKTNI